ncbi:hypothetical protein D3C85_1355040 [compost metagenome]
MAVLVLWIITIRFPLLQLSPFTDFGFEQRIAKCRDMLTVIGVQLQNCARLDVVVKEIVNNLVVIAHGILCGAMFRRPALWRHHSSVRSSNQTIIPKLAYFF